jgi:hypothetical protein
MASSNPPPSPTSSSYLEQTVSILTSVAGYMRLPALASTVRRLRSKPSSIRLNAGPSPATSKST